MHLVWNANCFSVYKVSYKFNLVLTKNTHNVNNLVNYSVLIFCLFSSWTELMKRIPTSSTLAYRALLDEQHKNITLNARIFPFFHVFPDSRHVSAICRVRETMAVHTFFVRTTNSTCVLFSVGSSYISDCTFFEQPCNVRSF